VSEEVAARHPLKGLIDVSPCDDGTLVTALYTRSVEFVPPVSHVMSGHYSFADSSALYTAAYETDLEKGTIKVEWIKIEGSTGVRVRKIPVFCWSLFESLQLLLVRLAARLSFLSATS
jgi:hypothetical protein